MSTKPPKGIQSKDVLPEESEVLWHLLSGLQSSLIHRLTNGTHFFWVTWRC